MTKTEIESLIKTLCGKAVHSLEIGKDPIEVLDFMHKITKDIKKACKTRVPTKPNYPDGEYVVVDAGCRRNPGPVEYRGILMPSGEEYFRVLPFDGTNNLGEFLAIVHALAKMKQEGKDLPIYSDSEIAIGWVNKKVCKTDFEKFGIMQSKPLADRAIRWLKTNKYRSPKKWKTQEWGEIPADYGRK